MRTTPTKETAYGMYNTYVGSYERIEMCFSMNQYPLVCDDVAYDVNNDENVVRVDDLLDSSEEVHAASKRGLGRQAARHGSTANPKYYQRPIFIRYVI